MSSCYFCKSEVPKNFNCLTCSTKEMLLYPGDNSSRIKYPFRNNNTHINQINICAYYTLTSNETVIVVSCNKPPSLNTFRFAGELFTPTNIMSKLQTILTFS